MTLRENDSLSRMLGLKPIELAAWVGFVWMHVVAIGMHVVGLVAFYQGVNTGLTEGLLGFAFFGVAVATAAWMTRRLPLVVRVSVSYTHLTLPTTPYV